MARRSDRQRLSDLQKDPTNTNRLPPARDFTSVGLLASTNTMDSHGATRVFTDTPKASTNTLAKRSAEQEDLAGETSIGTSFCVEEANSEFPIRSPTTPDSLTISSEEATSEFLPQHPNKSKWKDQSVLRSLSAPYGGEHGAQAPRDRVCKLDLLWRRGCPGSNGGLLRRRTHLARAGDPVIRDTTSSFGGASGRRHSNISSENAGWKNRSNCKKNGSTRGPSSRWRKHLRSPFGLLVSGGGTVEYRSRRTPRGLCCGSMDSKCYPGKRTLNI